MVLKNSDRVILQGSDVTGPSYDLAQYSFDSRNVPGPPEIRHVDMRATFIRCRPPIPPVPRPPRGRRALNHVVTSVRDAYRVSKCLISAPPPVIMLTEFLSFYFFWVRSALML
jgi:hypothetical protein